VRLRLILPRRRRGAGLRRLRRRRRRGSLRRWAAGAGLALALALAGCGAGHRSTSARGEEARSRPGFGPAFGLTEDNANLLWSPTAQAPAAAAPFLPARRSLTALHPRYVRLLVDWAALQPSPGVPPTFDAPVDGCARGVQPCGAYGGIAAELAAIASQQRAARAAGEPGFEVVVDVLGAPAWAALPPHGCETGSAGADARPLAAAALPAYRALIEGLAVLGRREGVALPWWSPWNEPNDPRFLSPQRVSCEPGAGPAAPAVYAELAREMSRALEVADPGARMLLGELGGYEDGSAHRLSVAQFVAALPAGALCLSGTWAVHAYAARGADASQGNPVAALEAALDARGGCAASARIWVTESGAGAPDPGRPRAGGAQEEQGACRALAGQLLAWSRDPRVEAIFQYEFRDDPSYPVGLASADLARLDADYRLWLRLRARPDANLELSSPQALCRA